MTQTEAERAAGSAVISIVTGDEASSVADDDRFPAIDWHDAFKQDFTQVNWLPGKLLEHGQQVALVGDGKAGKSLFMLEWLWRAVTGKTFLGDERRAPIKVLYFDRENSLRDIVTRLLAMGATPDDLAERFDYRLFPRFSGQLDTSSVAAGELLAIVEDVQPDIVILDTASRFIDGKENESDPWLQLYARVHVNLKRLGVACIRLDHFGKDKEKGARGNSAKTQDVDHVWELTVINESRGNNDGVETIATQLKLRRTHTRTGIGNDEVLVTRRGRRSLQTGMWLPGQTRHELTTTEGALNETDVDPTERSAAWLIQQLDAARIPDGPDGWGKPKVKEWCAGRQIRIANNKIEEAVRIRRARTVSKVPAELPYSPVAGQVPGAGGDTGAGGDVSAGQTCPGQVSGTSGAPQAPPPAPDLYREGAGGAGRATDAIGTCLGCNTPMTLLVAGQLWHYENEECAALYRQKHGDPSC